MYLYMTYIPTMLMNYHIITTSLLINTYYFMITTYTIAITSVLLQYYHTITTKDNFKVLLTPHENKNADEIFRTFSGRIACLM